MKPLILRAHPRRKPSINITSLIDVLFLLLIFFMVSSTFQEHPAIRLDLPQASTAEPSTTDALTLSITPDGTVYLDDEEVDRAELAVRLRGAVAGDADVTLILKADTVVPYGTVIGVIDTAKQAGIRHVTAFTEFPAPGSARQSNSAGG